MGSKGVFTELATLDCWLGGSAITPPATVYVALSTAAFDPLAAGSALSEPADPSYARAVLDNNAANFPPASAADPATKANGVDIVFPVAGADWGTLRSGYYLDAATDGNVLYGANLVTETPVLAGDAPVIPAGQFPASER